MYLGIGIVLDSAMFDGTASYSTMFELPKSILDTDLMLVLGYIDDIDKVYLNNERIGTVEDLKKEDRPG